MGKKDSVSIQEEDKEHLKIFESSVNISDAENKIKEHLSKYVLLEPHDGHLNFNLSSIFINYGSSTKKSDYIKRGLYFAKEAEKVISGDLKNEIQFNIANGHEHLGRIDNIWSSKKNLKKFPQNLHWQSGKRLFQDIWQKENNSKNYRLKSLVNLASSFAYVGRYIEVINILDEVIELDKNYGMAVYMKSSILIEYAKDLVFIGSRLSTEKMNNKESTAIGILEYSLKSLKTLLKNKLAIRSIEENGLPGVIETINKDINYLDNLKNLQTDFQIQSKELYNDITVNSFHDFMINNNLFLTYNIMDKEDGFGHYNDTTPNLRFSIDFDDYQILSALNEIKESYIFACEQLFNFTNSNTNLTHYIDKSMGYIDDSMGVGQKNGRDIHCLKTVVKESYDIFDKIMFILHKYLETNTKDREISWNSGFSSDLKKPKNSFWQTKENELKSFITDSQNPKYLIALYDLRQDMLSENGVYKDIKEARESITHRHLPTKINGYYGNYSKLDISELYKLALKSIKISKAGILYLLLFLDMDSANKATNKPVMHKYLPEQIF